MNKKSKVELLPVPTESLEKSVAQELDTEDKPLEEILKHEKTEPTRTRSDS